MCISYQNKQQNKSEQACKNQPSEHKKLSDFFYHNLITFSTNTTKASDAEFNALSSVIYRNKICIAFIAKHSSKNIPSVICTHMVDCCKPSYKYISIYQLVLSVDTIKFSEIIPDSFIVHLANQLSKSWIII